VRTENSSRQLSQNGCTIKTGACILKLQEAGGWHANAIFAAIEVQRAFALRRRVCTHAPRELNCCCSGCTAANIKFIVGWGGLHEQCAGEEACRYSLRLVFRICSFSSMRWLASST